MDGKNDKDTTGRQSERLGSVKCPKCNGEMKTVEERRGPYIGGPMYRMASVLKCDKCNLRIG